MQKSIEAALKHNQIAASQTEKAPSDKPQKLIKNLDGAASCTAFLSSNTKQAQIDLIKLKPNAHNLCNDRHPAQAERTDKEQSTFGSYK